MISDYPLLALGIALLFPLGGALLIRHQIAVGRVRNRGFSAERATRPVDFWMSIVFEAVMSIVFFFVILFGFANQSRLKSQPPAKPPHSPQIDGVLAPTAPNSLPLDAVRGPIHYPQQLPISDRSEWKRGK